MIKNERQYRITKAQAAKFEETLTRLRAAPLDKRVHPKLQKAQIDAVQSQLSDLLAEIQEYEALRDGKRTMLPINSVDDIPRALIQARIASGMSQEDLARRLGLKEQQIQRYEATDYAAANLARVSELAKVLGIQIGENVLVPGSEFSESNLLKGLSGAGLDRSFVVRRLLPRTPLKTSSEASEGGSGNVVLEVAEGLHRIFGWSPSDLFGSEPLSLHSLASATARFKLPARVRESSLGPYVMYAHYLSLLAIQATPQISSQSLSDDPHTVRLQIIEEFGEVSFETVLRYVWTRGIVVLPLNDSGTFHGACWRFKSRNVIVLKQRTRSTARWLHDLLHEYLHAARNPDLEEHPVIEEGEMSPERRNSEEEQAASSFAGDVVLNGRAEELTEQCVKAAKGRVESLKGVVPRIAKKAGVSVDALANYMAFRLSLQGINWWGTATNLQVYGGSLECTPRELFLEQAQLGVLNPIDRNLLMRALEPLVIGFAGKIASGKSTLSAEVAKALGWPRASFGDYLRIVAKSSGLAESREVLQEIGASLVAKDVEGFCRAVLTHYQWSAGEPLIIDGIRHAEVADALRRLVAPLELRVVYLEADEATRRARLRQSDGDWPNKLQMVESHSTEEQVKDRVPALADMRLPGNKPVVELVATVVNWVHQGDGVPCPV